MTMTNHTQSQAATGMATPKILIDHIFGPHIQASSQMLPRYILHPAVAHTGNNQ